MAGHSAESLLAWMKDTTRLRGWDAVIALDGAQFNGMLDETYRRGVGQGLSRPVPNGSVTIPDTQTSHFFSGCVLGAPALSFRHTSFERASLAWRMALLGGLHTVVEDIHGQHIIQRIAAYEPLNAPDLELDLALDSQGPSLLVDLGQGTNATLDFAGTPTEQREIGKFFQGWLSSPDNHERVFELGVFSEQSNELLQVRRIDVRSQLESPEAEPGSSKGALLLFTTMTYGVTGGLPNEEADFRYLIPNDDKAGYTATAVFSAHALHRAAFGHAVMRLLQTSDFEFITSADSPLQRMVAHAGLFAVPASEYQSADFAFRSELFSVRAFNQLHPLTIDFEYNQVTQNWSFPCTLDFSYRALDGGQWQARNATFNVSLKHEFHLDADGDDEQAMEGHLYTPYLYDEHVVPVGDLPDVLSAEEQLQINGFVAYTVKHALLKGFSQTLDAGGAERFLDNWLLPGEQSLQPMRRQMPYDLAVFGRIVAAPEAFSIVEQQAVVIAGETLQLTTQPARERLTWAVKIPSDGIADSYGTINEQGLYRAPEVPSMPQHVQRVLIEALDPVTLASSTVLISVVTSVIGVNPLVEVCNHDERIKLSASHARGGVLKWDIANRTPESGTLEDDPQGGKFYVAGPAGRDKTYVLDQITVSDGQSTQAIKVLVRRHAPALVVRVVNSSDGKVVLQARANALEIAARWSLDGPGLIQGNGLEGVYTSHPGTPERFVVVFASYEDPLGLGTLQGHLILPLPLIDSSDVLRALVSQPESSQGAARSEM
ncbi:hypothetical protein ALP92_03160 [Pseudomonas syringae pv. primulae]|uniref:Uncharacterized protein n=1 Tax=Pseudomonas syringae pv. primulae TaxID=251707 RepID=A0A3M4RP39_9PSED|nr:hypothetical protein ALP92_03160 [Pseudomonas syringae pv. primulae]